MASAFAASPIKHQSGNASLSHGLDNARRGRKVTVNERVEHILRGALREEEEIALREREGDPIARGLALQRSQQLSSLYETSTQDKFLRSRSRRNLPSRRKSSAAMAVIPARDTAGATIDEGDESDESDEDPALPAATAAVVSSPIKPADWRYDNVPALRASVTPKTSAQLAASPVKTPKPWYNCSPNATVKQQVSSGTTLDAKIRRYGARGTSKLLRGSASVGTLAPLSPIRMDSVAADAFVPGLTGSPSFWPPAAYYPTGSRLQATITHCPSSPVAVAIPANDAEDSYPLIREGEHCQPHEDAHNVQQQKEMQQLKQAIREEKRAEKAQREAKARANAEWQRRALHFEAPPELVEHRKQLRCDPQRRRRRSQHMAILQTPGYSPEKKHQAQARELQRQRFSLRWRSLARLLDAMRRTPCRRPVLQDMEKLFGLARELGARNALGACALSRAQFTLLLAKEFPLCDVKHVNRLFSSFDCELRDSLDVRLVLGAIRALRVQQGETVELVCASLRDFDDSTNSEASEGVVCEGAHLVAALSLCCASEEEEQRMTRRAEAIWTRVVAWQRQILARRLGRDTSGVSAWQALGGWTSRSRMSSHSQTHRSARDRSGRLDAETPTSPVGADETEPEEGTFTTRTVITDEGVDAGTDTGDASGREEKMDEGEEEEENAEGLTELMRLVDETRVPVRRVRVALKREQQTLALFTQQLLQRRHECFALLPAPSPRS